MKRVKSSLLALVASIFCLVPVLAGPGGGNPNPGVAPIGSSAYGKSYSEWVAAWWTWAVSIPMDQNPIVDTTGEFGAIGQSGNVWFLAGNFGGTDVRSLTVPTGKALFFPLYNSIWWAPDDLDDAAFVAGLLGLDPNSMSDEELIALIASFSISSFSDLGCAVDGVPLKNLESYRAASAPFPLIDTDFIDTLGAEISHPNFAVGDGYWLLLNPLTPGEHTIHLTVIENGPIFGYSEHEVTYHLTVKPGKK